MAKIFPFRAWRYNPQRVRLEEVATQPYDKISPAMQDRYYAASPYNLVRIILGKPEATDTDGNSVYQRAAANFRNWQNDGILLQDERPSIYRYTQRFILPDSNGQVRERQGFIALARIEDYDAGVIFRHEQTLSAPKADRLNLLRATQAHFGQIFMLYDDPSREVDSRLASSVDGEAPLTVQDEYGVQHALWECSDPDAIAEIQVFMQSRKLIIADGHHRYETALNYRNEQRKLRGDMRDGNAPYERVMMTFVNMSGEGIAILPTHRVIHGLSHFNIAEFVERLRRYFTVNPLRERASAASAAQLLAHAGEDHTALVAVTGPGDFILEARPEADSAPVLAGLSPGQRQLDVVKLHRLILNDVLNIAPEAIEAQRNVQYYRDADQAIERVQSGADVAFLMNPVHVEQLRDVALAGETMPQKSTDFYPKLLSGLTIYALE